MAFFVTFYHSKGSILFAQSESISFRSVEIANTSRESSRKLDRLIGRIGLRISMMHLEAHIFTYRGDCLWKLEPVDRIA